LPDSMSAATRSFRLLFDLSDETLDEIVDRFWNRLSPKGLRERYAALAAPQRACTRMNLIVLNRLRVEHIRKGRKEFAKRYGQTPKEALLAGTGALGFRCRAKNEYRGHCLEVVHCGNTAESRFIAITERSCDSEQNKKVKCLTLCTVLGKAENDGSVLCRFRAPDISILRVLRNGDVVCKTESTISVFTYSGGHPVVSFSLDVPEHQIIGVHFVFEMFDGTLILLIDAGDPHGFDDSFKSVVQKFDGTTGEAREIPTILEAMRYQCVWQFQDGRVAFAVQSAFEFNLIICNEQLTLKYVDIDFKSWNHRIGTCITKMLRIVSNQCVALAWTNRDGCYLSFFWVPTLTGCGTPTFDATRLLLGPCLRCSSGNSECHVCNIEVLNHRKLVTAFGEKGLVTGIFIWTLDNSLFERWQCYDKLDLAVINEREQLPPDFPVCSDILSISQCENGSLTLLCSLLAKNSRFPFVVQAFTLL